MEVSCIYSGDSQTIGNEWRHIASVDTPQKMKALNNAESFSLHFQN